MTRTELLTKLDPLTYRDRQLELVAVARTLEEPTLRALLDALDGDLFEAHCALTMACAAGLSDILLKAFAWPWPEARRRAALLLTKVEFVPQGLPEALKNLDLVSRRAFLKRVRRTERTDLARTLIAYVEQHFGPAESCLLLPALEGSELEEWLPRVGYRMDSWRTLAGRHPDRMLTWWRQELEKSPLHNRTSRWYEYSSAIGILAEKRPSQLLQLAHDLGPVEAVWSAFRGHWNLLLTKQPERVATLLSQKAYRHMWSEHGLPQGIVAHFRLLDGPTRHVFASAFADREWALTGLLATLAPADREALFEGATAGIDRSQLRWSEPFLSVLPHSMRASESERMLALPEVATSLEATVSALAFLPPQKAHHQLLDLSNHPNVEVRTRAWRSRVLGAGLYREQTTQVIDGLQQLKNEADPVRAAALGALSQWPLLSFEAAHIDSLKTLLGDVCGAGDTSTETHGAFLQLALRWVRAAEMESPFLSFALEVLSRLAEATSSLHLPYLEGYSKAKRKKIVSALSDRLLKELEKENPEPLIDLAQALGEHLKEHPEVENRLQPLTRAKDEWTARTAISLWLENPLERATRVEALLSFDPSAIVVSPVMNVVHRERQDLLDPFLKGVPIEGRFLSGKTVHVLSLSAGFERWLPRQQEALARLLQALADDPTHSLEQRASALRRWQKLCYLSDEMLSPYLQHPQLSLREAALASLTQNPEPLLNHLHSQEARAAVKRLGYLVRRRSPAKAVELLERGLASPAKLTSQKELLRLFGVLRQLEPPARAWKKKNQHRDLQIAALHALGEMLDLEQARELYLEAFTAENEWVAQAGLSASKQTVPPAARRAWTQRMAQLVGRPEPTLAQAAWATLRHWSDEAPDNLAPTAAEGICDLDCAHWRSAVKLLVACSAAAQKLVPEIVLRLLEQDRQSREGRDLPARQRLRHLLERFSEEPHPEFRKQLLGSCRQLPLGESQLTYLVAVPTEPWLPLAQEVESFEQMEALLTAVLRETQRPEWDTKRMLQKAQELAREESLVARRVAVEILGRVGQKTNWNRPCRYLLQKLRDDPYHGVAERARLLVMVKEY